MGIGLRDHYAFETQELSDRSEVSVNVANGNVILHALDLRIRGTGLEFMQARYYDGLEPGAGHFGKGWVVHPNVHSGLKVSGDGSVGVNLPDDGFVRFPRNGDGSYTTPTGTNATLVRNADGTYKLTFYRSKVSFEYDTAGLLTRIKDKNNNTITLQYAGGRIASITDTQGRVTTFRYGSNGYVDQITDPSGRTVRYGYSGDKLRTVTNADLELTQYRYNAAGDLIEITSNTGESVTKLSYDASHRVTQVRRMTDLFNGLTTSYTYNAGNTVSTDPRGNRTTYHYDGERRVTRVVDALGRQRSVTYNGNSEVETYTNALGKVTTATYDARSNLTSLRSPMGARSSFSYDLVGPHPYFPGSSTDEQGNHTNYRYDAIGNLIEKSDGPTGQNPIRFTYNANGTVATATDAKGALTSYSYDPKGNLTRITHPAPLGAVSYAYDGLSRVRSETDGKGQTTRYEYDPLDRITRVVFHDGEDVTYSYDGDGNRIQRNDSTGISHWEYDPLSRLTEQRLQNGSAVTTYTYDPASNLASLTDEGGTVTYAYNQVNRLISLTEPGGHQTTFNYDPNDDRTQTNYPNGVSLLVTYDDSERLTSIVGKKLASGQVFTSSTYSYADSFGDTDLRTRVTDGVTGVTTSYGYDALNRLTSASGGGQNYSYAYDANGNRTSKTVNGITTTYSYNAANQLTAAGGTTYVHDGNGNLTGSSTGLAYTYNVKDQTVSIRAVAGAETRDLEYAGTNQWEWISEHGFASGFQDFQQSALGISIRSGTGDTTYYTRDDDGTLIGQRVLFGSRYYYLFDGAGSVVGLTDASGNVAATYRYEPFGQLVSETGAVPNPWRFHGQYYSSATQKYKIGLRWYDPALGRWTQRDPIDQPLRTAGWNPYDYADNNPVNFSDPTGQLSFSLKHFALGVYEAAEVVVYTGAGLGIAYGCSQAVVLSGGVGAAIVGGPCAAATFGAGATAGILARQSIKNFRKAFQGKRSKKKPKAAKKPERRSGR